MLLFITGLTWCVTSVLGTIPSFNHLCVPQANVANACIYGNLTVTLFSKQLKPKDCNSQVDINEFKHPPVIHINSTNTTDRFTVVMVDLGPQGQGPEYLEWMVTNVSITSLPNYQTIPASCVLAGYQQPVFMYGFARQTLIRILVFRHQNVLRVPFGELYITMRKHFSFRTLFSNTGPNLRLCGPVAGTQYWVTDSDFTPSAPPAIPAQGVQPVAPVLVPMVPMVPVGHAPGLGVPVQPGYNPSIAHPAAVPDQHQHLHTTFPKKSSAVNSEPLQVLLLPLVILAVMCL